MQSDMIASALMVVAFFCLVVSVFGTRPWKKVACFVYVFLSFGISIALLGSNMGWGLLLAGGLYWVMHLADRFTARRDVARMQGDR